MVWRKFKEGAEYLPVLGIVYFINKFLPRTDTIKSDIKSEDILFKISDDQESNLIFFQVISSKSNLN